MKHLRLLPALGLSVVFVGIASGHDLGNVDDPHPHYDWTAKPPEMIQAPEWFLAQAKVPPASGQASVGDGAAQSNRPAQAAVFEAFSPRVKVRWNARFLFVESNGLPAHGMMIGITNWQQQVPMPQNYTGANAWQIPLLPTPSKTPASIKGRFLRGAIALAANGIPIFNPQNNRGEVSAEIGELDEWGGHCGRADDYHYHAAPLHLQSVVGKGQPIAYALDGYPIYGLTEPDGSEPAGLDSFNGHDAPGLGYHYHASKKYPYVNGGFHGEVTESGGQVDPQPRAHSVRKDMPPLRGAKITGFTASSDETTFAMQYAVNGKPAEIHYAIAGEGVWKFQFVNADGSKQEETYRAGDARGGGGDGPKGRPPQDGDTPPRDRDAEPPSSSGNGPASGSALSPKPFASFVLRSSEVADGGALPVEYTGDGAGSTLPLDWAGAPPGTKSYALIMHHLDREGKTKWYWTLYNIPANVTHLDKNNRNIGTLGSSFKGKAGYEPPHSQGPGAKTYVLTLYALSSAPEFSLAGSLVSGDVLSAAIKDRVLATADLKVVYSREGASAGPGKSSEPKGRPPAPKN